VLATLRRAVPFAPLHLPSEIAALDAIAARAPSLPQVVCFDTTFHRTMPPVARRFPLPREVLEGGIQRYGFHGLSYEYVVDHVGAVPLGRAVVAHLGHGASLAAIRDGASVDTTMGFTPAGGVMMGTRTGDLDPGLLVHLLTDRGFDARSLDRLVTTRSGLAGVSGVSSDMRTLLDRRAHDPDAALAVEMFCYQVRKAIGALAASLGGIDTLVFTGGIGEHASIVRDEVCSQLGHLGVTLDAQRNALGGDIVSTPDGRTTVRVVRTNEQLMIARHVLRVLGRTTA
jgi:acetate kinase